MNDLFGKKYKCFKYFGIGVPESRFSREREMENRILWENNKGGCCGYFINLLVELKRSSSLKMTNFFLVSFSFAKDLLEQMKAIIIPTLMYPTSVYSHFSSPSQYCSLSLQYNETNFLVKYIKKLSLNYSDAS